MLKLYPTPRPFSLLLAKVLLFSCLFLSCPFLGLSGELQAESKKPAKEHGAKEESGGKAEKKKSSKKKKPNPEKELAQKPTEPDLGKGKYDSLGLEVNSIDAVLLLDASRSMQRTDPKRLRDQAAKLFLRFLSNSDRVAIVQFDRDAKTLVGFTPISPETVAALDEQIKDVPTEGGFTDLNAGLQEAFLLLTQEGREGVGKTIVVFSDGKMDPHPSSGTAQELTGKVESELLPKFSARGISLYSVALSEEADKDLLANFSKRGGGLSWYAPDSSSIHKRFSELFLTLKRPQVVPLEGAGFEVDPSVREATFYIPHKQKEPEVVIFDPRGQAIDSANIPPEMKWFHGDMFDVVTIQRPLPGRWKVQGQEGSEGFASLLSDLKLQVRWPKSNLKIGESVSIAARMVSREQEALSEGFRDITFYTYKVINADNGAVLTSGDLRDKGAEGDEHAGDGIYSTKLKISEEGNYQIFFAVTSPTFTRQQRISFSVSSAELSLRVKPADEFSAEEESVQVLLSKTSIGLKNKKIKVLARPIAAPEHKAAAEEGIKAEHKAEVKETGHEEQHHAEPLTEAKEYTLTPKPSEDDPLLLEVPVNELPNGYYQLVAKLTAQEGKKELSFESDSLAYEVTKGVEAVAEESHAQVSSAGTILGVLCSLLTLPLVWFLKRWAMKRIEGKKSQVQIRTEYQVPQELTAKIGELRAAAEGQRRRASDSDKVFFALVSSVYEEEDGQAHLDKHSDNKESDKEAQAQA